MPRRLVRKFMPDPSKLQNNKSLGFLGKILHEPNLWHINRHAVARAFFAGLIVAWIPLPFQMGIAALAAVWINCNLPITVLLCWITNPLTMPPIFYFNYWVGAHLLQREPADINFELSLGWLSNQLYQIGLPLYLGSLVVGVCLALLAYVLVDYLWRRKVRQNWRLRAAQRAARRQLENAGLHSQTSG